MRSTRGLSVGVATLVGSITNPRVWAYSTNASVNRGATASASATMALRLSGIHHAEDAVEERQAASQPAITTSVVSEWVSHTNMRRENTA